MKLQQIISLVVLSVSILLNSCIHENISDCPQEESVRLSFNYPNFDEHINQVRVLIYNESGLVVQEHEVKKESLSHFAGIGLNLLPGNYKALCWANAQENTQIKGSDKKSHLSALQVAHPSYFGAQETYQTNDPLYYGSQNFSVLNNTSNQATVTFKPAYIRLVIEVLGLTLPNLPEDMSQYPYIRVNNLAPAYDYTMTPQGSLTTYHPPLVFNSQQKKIQSICNVLRFKQKNPITIELINNTTPNSVLHRLSLEEFIQQENITISSDQEITIPIRITFNSNGVITVVVIQNWQNTPSITIP